MLSNQRGAAALVAIIIVTALVVLISVSMGVVAMNNLETGFSAQRSGDVLLTAESCAEEAVLRLGRDATYSGEVLTVDDVTCTIIVIGTPCGDCAITSEASAAGFTRSIQVEVSVSGSTVDITSWEEID